MNQPPQKLKIAPIVEPKAQFIRIDRGISQFNHDYYAALGLPIIASPMYIRHVYLSIARILHPDVYGFSAEKKELATQYLAKLVNPAYNILMKEQERNAYEAIFKLLAKRLMKKSRNIQIHSTIACELMMAPSDGFYERSVSAIAKIQYQSLENILEYTGQISELNLVYILYKEGYQYGDNYMPPVLAPMVIPRNSNLSDSDYSQSSAKSGYVYPTPQYGAYQNSSQNSSPNSGDRPSNADETIIQSSQELTMAAKAIADRLKLCEIYMSQNEWNIALKELREILQLDKRNSKCLAMLGVVYKNINQPQMAKISLKQALSINPQEPLALKHMKEFSNPKPVPPIAATKPLPPPQKRGWLSNLLGWASSDKPK